MRFNAEEEKPGYDEVLQQNRKLLEENAILSKKLKLYFGLGKEDSRGDKENVFFTTQKEKKCDSISKKIKFV